MAHNALKPTLFVYHHSVGAAWKTEVLGSSNWGKNVSPYDVQIIDLGRIDPNDWSATLDHAFEQIPWGCDDALMEEVLEIFAALLVERHGMDPATAQEALLEMTS